MRENNFLSIFHLYFLWILDPYPSKFLWFMLSCFYLFICWLHVCMYIDTMHMYLYIQSFQMFLLALKKIDLTFFTVHHHFPLWVLPLVSCLISSFSEILYFTGILVILVTVFLGWMYQRPRHSFTYLCILNTHSSAECLETY